MYSNLKAHGLGGFTNNVYWSSSETSLNGAWGQSFTGGIQGPTGKNYLGYVRSIRAF